MYCLVCMGRSRIGRRGQAGAFLAARSCLLPARRTIAWQLRNIQVEQQTAAAPQATATAAADARQLGERRPDSCASAASAVRCRISARGACASADEEASAWSLRRPRRGACQQVTFGMELTGVLCLGCSLRQHTSQLAPPLCQNYDMQEVALR